MEDIVRLPTPDILHNLRLSLEKRYSSLTGQLREVHANIARIKRETAKLPELEAEIPKLEALIASADMLLKHADPSWTPEQTPAIKPPLGRLPFTTGWWPDTEMIGPTRTLLSPEHVTAHGYGHTRKTVSKPIWNIGKPA